MITVKIPGFSYRSEVILRNIDMGFERGHTHGIVGLNGAGKTTFFNLLSGFLVNEDIEIRYDGEPLLKKNVAFVDTDLYFYPKLTAREFLAVFKSFRETYNEERLADLLKIPLDGFIEEFSTGMKKKLLLLSQVKQNKQVYILDEPFNGLDLETNKVLEVIIAALNERGKTIFISSHILDPLIAVCYKIHHIKDHTIAKTYGENEFSAISDDLFGEYTRLVKRELQAIL